MSRKFSYPIKFAIGLILSLCLLSACAPVKPGTFTDLRGQLIHREFLSHSKNKPKKIEVFWTKPAGEGPWPAIVFIHGHQEIRIGGEAFVKWGRLRRMARRGYVAASVSQPGYGNSDGPPDFCGPFTQNAVLQAIAFLREKPFVKADKVGLIGVSRGAIVASMVATQDPKLAAVVLLAGTYDLEEAYPKIYLQGIIRNIDFETGGSAAAFRARSAIHHAKKIKSPLLILHGENDDRLGPSQAETLGRKVRANGIPVQVKMFEGVGHSIPVPLRWREIYPFLREYLR